MHQRHTKLFESGGETVKRNLLECYSMQNRKPNNNEDYQLREQVERLTNELINLKNKDKTKVYEDKQIQCEDKRQELLNEVIKQKDKSIEQYEKQILSFKNMILQSNYSDIFEILCVNIGISSMFYKIFVTFGKISNGLRQFDYLQSIINCFFYLTILLIMIIYLYYTHIHINY